MYPGQGSRSSQNSQQLLFHLFNFLHSSNDSSGQRRDQSFRTRPIHGGRRRDLSRILSMVSRLNNIPRTKLSISVSTRVPFVLFGQALMFYTPYYLWKMWEGSKVRSIIQGMHIFTIKEKAEVLDEKEEILTGYIVSNLHEHNRWAISYFVCELLNLVSPFSWLYGIY